MIQTRSKLNKLIIVTGLIILSVFIGYFLPHKPVFINKETSVFYKVVEVIDGDTIKVESDGKIETIRLLGVDTPEIVNPYKSEGCFGLEASQRTKKILENKEVYLIPDPLSPNKDKFDRLLRYVFLPDGLFVNAELIKEGYAFNYIYGPIQFMKQFDFYEKEAKEKRRGLWNNNCNYF